MRHQKFSQRLSRRTGHRRATLRNLVISLIKHQRIKTTKAKAKFVRPVAERLISLAKQNNLQTRRHALKIIDDKMAVAELFSRISPLFKDRSSGFTRIIPLANRRGDGATMVFLEFTEQLPKLKPKKLKKDKIVQEQPAAQEIEGPKLESKQPERPKLSKQKAKPIKKIKPKKFLSGLRKLFKKERDSL